MVRLAMGCSNPADEVNQDAMRETAHTFQHTSLPSGGASAISGAYFGYGFSDFSYAGDWFISGAEARCVVV